MAKAKRAHTRFNPEGSGFDERTGDELIKMSPLRGAAPEKFQGDVIRQGDSFQAWVWHGDSVFNGGYKRHGSSLDPRTGMVLKGRKHETWHLMEQEEVRRGNMIIKKDDGRYYSVPNIYFNPVLDDR